MPSHREPASHWQVLLPIRATPGKSRLGGVEDPTTYFARDTIAAARGSSLISTVTVVGREMAEADRVLADPGPGLSAAIEAGLQALDPALPVIVMLADLPSLRTSDLDQVLARCHGLHRAIVIDHSGLGTTMALSHTTAFTPRFGEGSAALFLGDGFVSVEAPRTARLDVDTPEDLQQALRLGVGPATAGWWKRTGAPSYTYCR